MEAARSRRDSTRHEPHFGPAAESAPHDALAELARLVGHDDHYRNVFRPAHAVAGLGTATPAAYHAPGEEPDPDATGEPTFGHARSDDQAGAAYGWPDGSADQGGSEHAYGDDRHGQDHYGQDHYGQNHYGQDHHGQEHHGQDHYGQDPHGEDPHGHDADHQPGHFDDQGYGFAALPHEEAGIADEHLALEAAISDIWAKGGFGRTPSDPEVYADGAPAADGPRDRAAARRPLVVLAAVLLLTGGGLAGTFMAKGHTVEGVAAARGVAPTILAATGPTKVKLDDGTQAPEDKDAALLSKNSPAASGPIKVVSSEEQPVDLNQLPKPSDLADGAQPLPPPPPNPFPEPKKVKTFLVHPDGSMLGEAAPAMQPPAAVAQLPAGDPTSALPSTPATASRGGTTPRPATIASLVADPAPAPSEPASSPRQPAQAGVHPAPSPTEAVPAASPSGSYGLQLAASPSETEANAVFAKLKKKYPAQLGPYAATVRKSDTGAKPVYRVRVGGLKQDEAKSLCSQLQAGGGSCFVIHN